MTDRQTIHKAALSACIVWGLLNPKVAVGADSLPDTVARVKASIVGVGTFLRTRTPPAQLRGTGFVVADGRHILTNAHVVPELKGAEKFVIFVGIGQPQIRLAVKAAEDKEHDLTLLKMSEEPLPALKLGDSGRVREGETYAFTGFPLGAMLGLYPTTHHALVAAIVPLAVPLNAARDLTPAITRRLKQNYAIFQLDGTAYPGNSGSPLYNPATGEVVAVVNKVFVQETKESVLQRPSGISYAIPINFARELLQEAGLATEEP